MTVEWEEYLPDLPEVGDADLDAVETRRGVSLPADYRATVKQHVGETPLPENMAVGERGIVPVGPLFFAKADHDGAEADQNIWYWIEAVDQNFPAELAGKLLPFASDTAQGIFAFDYRGGDAPAVVFLNLESAADETSIFPVAESWDGFLAALQR
ncbi:SMI1/KNR4 family protein [Paracoccus sediminicola]|uniref:SMI1/KNR4 family protein n=1 Tax=Paracoccus sediminicola TaxID=3017783 RepID=UPI0022F089BB|nr:SMI1/KNR4 family protein [Paracoccus sediminicola]WBU57678.1 SMI1/KNR4 family protein [Paracoccus sediminicola]